MAYEIPGFSFSLPSGSDFSATNQHRFVDENASGQAVVPVAAGGKVIGVRQNKPGTGQAMTVVHNGISRVEAGAAVAQGDVITTDALGRCITAGGGDTPLGIAQEAASGAGIFIAVLLFPASRVATGRVISIPVQLAAITGNISVVTNWTPGFAGKITAVNFLVTTPATTAAKLTTLTTSIGATPVTGGVLALTSANCTPLGAVVAGSAVTAANVFTATSTLSIASSATTAFVEGQGVILISISA